jgi:hypothetical protein
MEISLSLGRSRPRFKTGTSPAGSADALAALVNDEPIRLTTLAYAAAVVAAVVIGQRMQVRRGSLSRDV